MTSEKRSARARGRPPTAVESALAVVTAGLALVAAVLALVGSSRASSPASLPQSDKRPARRRGRSPTAAECAMAVVTAGVAIAAAMLALAGSARASSLDGLLEEAPYLQGPLTAVSYARAVATVALPAEPSPTTTPPFSPTPTPAPTPTPTPAPEFMAMPVEGVWQVTCGYRCGRHDEDHVSTFALDVVRVEGETAGQEVRSPVAGRIVTVEDSSTYICRGEEIEGPEGGAVVVIDFQAPSGAAHRLRLVHLDVGTVPDELKPDGKPVPVDAGVLLGVLAEMDGCSHLHINLTLLEERQEVPVPMAIEGTPLDDCDGEDCWHDALIPIEER